MDLIAIVISLVALGGAAWAIMSGLRAVEVGKERLEMERNERTKGLAELAESLGESRSDLSHKIDSCRRDIETLIGRARSLEVDRTSLAKRVDVAERELGALAKARAKIEADLSNILARIRKVESDRTQLRRDLDVMVSRDIETSPPHSKMPAGPRAELDLAETTKGLASELDTESGS